MAWVAVWQRNFLVWRKLLWSAFLGNLAEPIVGMVGLGLGLGALLPAMDGIPYRNYLALGMVVNSALISAAVEALWSAFARMHVQKTWDAIMNTPVSLTQIVMGEWIWAASKSIFYSTMVLLAGWLVVGLEPHWSWALLPPCAFVVGLTSAAIALIATSLAKGWEFLMNFFMVFMMPMAFISGVYFPIHQLPAWLQGVAKSLPLWHAIELIKPLLMGQWPSYILVHCSILLIYIALGLTLATKLFRRRLIN